MAASHNGSKWLKPAKNTKSFQEFSRASFSRVTLFPFPVIVLSLHIRNLSNCCRHKVWSVIFTNFLNLIFVGDFTKYHWSVSRIFLDLIFGWNLTLGPTMQQAPLSALAWRSKAHKQNNPFSIRRWKDCPSRSPSFNTLNEEHGTYGGGWGEIDESNLSIQLQHCNYTVVVVVAQTTTAHCKFYRFFCSFSVSLRLDSWGWNKIDKWQKSRNERCDLTKKTLAIHNSIQVTGNGNERTGSVYWRLPSSSFYFSSSFLSSQHFLTARWVRG